jgi:hypothetical protein
MTVQGRRAPSRRREFHEQTDWGISRRQILTRRHAGFAGSYWMSTSQLPASHPWCSSGIILKLYHETRCMQHVYHHIDVCENPRQLNQPPSVFERICLEGDRAPLPKGNFSIAVDAFDAVVPSDIQVHSLPPRRNRWCRNLAASATSSSKSKLPWSISVPAKSRSCFRDGWSRRPCFKAERRRRVAVSSLVAARVAGSEVVDWRSARPDQLGWRFAEHQSPRLEFDDLSRLDELIECSMRGGVDAVGEEIGGLVTTVGPAV